MNEANTKLLSLGDDLPADEISGEALHVEAPEVFVSRRADLHAVTARSEAALNDSICINQTLASQGVDLQSVPHMRIQKLEYRMHRT